jgi:hypothetical protein
MKNLAIKNDVPGRDRLNLELLPELPERLFNLFQRNGVYYARVRFSPAGDPMEIALHGAISEEQAHAAVKVLTPCGTE